MTGGRIGLVCACVALAVSLAALAWRAWGREEAPARPAPVYRPAEGFSPEANEAMRRIIEELSAQATLPAADALWLRDVGHGLPEREMRRVRTRALAVFTDFTRVPGAICDEGQHAMLEAALIALDSPDRHIRHAGVALASRRVLRDLPEVRERVARLVDDPADSVADFARASWPDVPYSRELPPGAVLVPRSATPATPVPGGAP